MKQIRFYNGKQSQIMLRDLEQNDEKLLVKQADGLEFSQLSKQAILNEYQLLKDLKLKGVRSTLGLEQQGESVAILLEYIEGDTLKNYFADGRRTLLELLKAAVNIVEVLEAVHRHRIIHKDINPDNILVRKSDGAIYLIDFGLAGKLDTRLEHLGNPERLQGTLQYISPEQTGRMDKVIDNRSDLYSLGVTFYELITGRLPFEGETPLELVHAHLALAPVPPSSLPMRCNGYSRNVPDIFSQIVMKLLAKDPHDRYKSAEGLKYDLHHCLQLLQETGVISEFELMTRDYSDKLIIPEKLYGMEAEVNFLKEKFAAAAEGKSSVVMIKGYSGVGKSSLVKALYRELSGKKALLISGKYDQLQRSIPLSAFVSAFSSLVDLLQSENNVQREAWRQRLLEALGGLGKVLTNLVPNLEQLIGVQPDVPELSTVESQNRLEFLVRELVRCIASADHPLVIFIDDLQWADEASLALLKQLSITGTIQGLLLLGTYRDNEVGAAHPLQMTLQEVEREKPINYIEVKNLSLVSINRLLADTLNRSLAETEQLAALIKDKTGGNAFFVFQFLRSLYEEGGISYNYGTHRWTWNDTVIRGMKITDNVVELLTNSLNKLPVETIDALKMASCIGNPFRLKYLARMMHASGAQTFEILEAALREGFISVQQGQQWNLSFMNEEIAEMAEFSFNHDRIQQAVYNLVAEEERALWHVAIGRLLLANNARAEVGSQVFEIVNQFDAGIHLITDELERATLASLNNEAGSKASQSAAYGQASVYYENGIRLLRQDAWKEQYDLCLALYIGGAESAYLSGNHARMEELVQMVLQNGKTVLDKIPVYNTLVDAYTAAHDLPKAIKAGLEALKSLGVSFPANPKLLHVFAGLGKTKFKLAGKKVEDLIDLPAMTNPYMLQAMPLMERISPAAYMSGSQLFPLLVFRMVDISLEHGNSSLSAFGYASFAITLSGVLGDYDGGLRFAEMSKRLLEKYQDEVYKVKVYFVNYCFIRHWKFHANTMIDPLMDAYRSGMKAGNLFSGNWVACYALIWKYIAGYPLDKLKTELKDFTVSFRQLNQFGAFNLADIVLQTIERLTDKTPVQFVGGSETEEAAILQRCIEAEDKTALFCLHLHRMQLNYFFGDYEKARKCAHDAAVYLEAVVGLHFIPLYHFYQTLIILADPTSNARDIKQAKASIKKMKVWAKHAPANYFHKYQLMLAKWAVRHRKDNEARTAFDAAIAAARENGYLQEEALAMELASRFYRVQGVKHMEQTMTQGMLRLYRNWGAVAKLQKLGYDETGAVKSRSESLIASTYGSENEGTAMLDMESILKASSMLAGEIDADRLMQGFMRILMENSGADRGVLLLLDHDKLILKADVAADTKKVDLINVMMNDSLAGDVHEVPQSIIRVVSNSMRIVTINDTHQNHEFSNDPYFASRAVKSLTCFNLLNQNKAVGVVYLENSLLADVFSAERRNVLSTIGSQFAVTLNNIILYQHTLKLNTAYERFVPKQFLGYLEKESIIEVALGDNTQAFMTLLFLDIRGFTSMSERMTPQENFYFINKFLGFMEPVVSRFGGLIDKYTGDGIMALFPGPADKAVAAGTAMLRALADFNQQRIDEHLAPIRIGIGMHSGNIMLGTVGGSERMDTTVIGETVNVASRIEGLNKEYATSMLITEATYAAIESPGNVHLRKMGTVPVRGIEKRITIFEVFSEIADRDLSVRESNRSLFETAVELFEQGSFEAAELVFDQVLQLEPGDQAASFYRQKCAERKA